MKKCPKCESPMDEGKLAGGAYNAFISNKVKGIPLLNPQKIKQTKAYMCEVCGFIELYGLTQK